MIYFASDIHLGCGSVEEARTRERRFTAWLDRAAEDAEAIFLLGDLFDFWFEYRRVVPQGFVRTLGKLAALTDRGIRVVFFTGNHDMWVGDYLYRECGVEIHTSEYRPFFVSSFDECRFPVAVAALALFMAGASRLGGSFRPVVERVFPQIAWGGA